MGKALDFYRKYKRGFGIACLSTLVILLNYFWFHSNTEVLTKQLAVAEHNLQVANDTIRMSKDKAGKAQYEKLAYLTNTVDNLTKLNKELSNDVRQIKGTVSTIIDTKIQIVEKRVPFLVRAELLDSQVISHFNYDTIYSPGNFRKLSGYTKYNPVSYTHLTLPTIYSV